MTRHTCFVIPGWFKAIYNIVALHFTEHGSEDFNRFLKLLGDRVRLKGWEKFKAGLDCKCTYVSGTYIYNCKNRHFGG